MGVDTLAFVNEKYSLSDIYEALKTSKKVSYTRFSFYNRIKYDGAAIDFTWAGDTKRMLYINTNQSSDDKEVPKNFSTELSFGFMDSSKEIIEYILAHCGGGWMKLRDTSTEESFYQVYPYGKQIVPKQYSKILKMLGIEERINKFINGNNKDKIRVLFE